MTIDSSVDIGWMLLVISVIVATVLVVLILSVRHDMMIVTLVAEANILVHLLIIKLVLHAIVRGSLLNALIMITLV